ncbi:lysylphosphatidylglycerol synthase domain-containing protein [Chitinasiproducens palmae]|uniref:Putative membrane protein n=1 Tax=Chitinasiproducens palmae TaxID=1770053 RepID=A0A1H2PT81_9BURK|nr:lysylphosphatidylglycerol synthase domain-containing protein [Chitinasiproducens palmae]SDV49861.1 putative membrane protein [Chitinasiproducens palmae]
MRRAALLSLLAGGALLLVLLAWQGMDSVLSALALVGWGVLSITALHLPPLLLDAGAIAVLLRPTSAAPASPYFRSALLARWLGESVNSLMPAGQIGGPVLMVRHLTQRGLGGSQATAVITVSTTLQTAAQLVFTLVGIAVCCAYASGNVTVPLLSVSGVLLLLLYAFYVAQRRGLFEMLVQGLGRALPRHDWTHWLERARGADLAVQSVYRNSGSRAAWSFALSLVGWAVGVAEVWLALRLLGHPVGWTEALLLESLGQAVRAAAFAIPGALGVQEGGYLLLAHLVGLPPSTALALSLLKRAREIILAVPGIVYLQHAERRWRRIRAQGAG